MQHEMTIWMNAPSWSDYEVEEVEIPLEKTETIVETQGAEAQESTAGSAEAGPAAGEGETQDGTAGAVESDPETGETQDGMTEADETDPETGKEQESTTGITETDPVPGEYSRSHRDHHRSRRSPEGLGRRERG